MTRPIAPRPYRGGPRGPVAATGASIATLVGPNPLWASNGVVVGPDGRLWIAQFLGGLVSALDLATGELEPVIQGPHGPLVGPDDLAVDRATGAVYVVDLPPGLVWRRDPDGSMAVVADGIVAPDGIAVHDGRLFVNELTPDGRLLEIDLDGGPPRVLATGLVMGNAMEVGPDGSLYYPHLGGGEVWRVGLDGGAPERVLSGLSAPVAVRFSRDGHLLVLSNAEPVVWVYSTDGTLLRTVEIGVEGADNLAVGPDGTWYVTGAFGGGLVALGPDGSRSTVLPEGLAGPFGLVATDTGSLVVADHHRLVSVSPDGALDPLGAPWRGSPTGVRDVALRGEEIVATSDFGRLYVGDAVRLDGLSDPAGVAVVDDGLLVVESGAGRVVHIADDDTVTERATGFARPCGVAVSGGSGGSGSDAVVSDVERGQVVRLSDGAVLAAGLDRPEGLAMLGGDVWCLEAGGGRLLRIDPRTRAVSTVVTGLPLAVAPSFAHPRHATNPFARRPEPFAGLAVDGDTLVVGCSGDGSIRRITVG